MNHAVNCYTILIIEVTTILSARTPSESEKRADHQLREQQRYYLVLNLVNKLVIFQP
jgi:hypothetical protein